MNNISFAKILGVGIVCISTIQVDPVCANPKSRPIFQVSQGFNDAGIAAPKIRTRPLTPAEQVEVLVDIRGLWAETAIATLVSKDIMPAFSDSTFRPNDEVTQSQFQEILVKAFPNSRFKVSAPNQKMTKAQGIVGIVKTLNLKSSNTNLGNTFVDAAKIPKSARAAIATAVSQKLIFSYPDVTVLSPNETLTRIDLASLIYQGLALKGKLPQLQGTDIAQVYLVGRPRQAIAQVPPQFIPTPSPKPNQPQLTVEPEVIRQNLRVPIPVVKQFAVATKSKGSPSISMTVPTGFGASAGNAFIGAGYQSATRLDSGRAGEDAGFSFGIGAGNPQELVGLEVSFNNYAFGGRSTVFETGGINFKLHRIIAENTSIALGVENAFIYGGASSIPSVYGVISTILQFQDSPDQPFSSVGFTLGVGGGRFRSISDVNTLKGTVNVFGSVAVRVVEQVSLIADWNGQSLSLGASIKPFRDIPFVITPGFTDVVGDNTNGAIFNGLNGARFILGVGYGIYF